MSDFLDWSTLIYRAPALLIAMALHEYAHAYVSDSLGGSHAVHAGAAYGESSGSLGYGGAYASCDLRFRLGKTGGDQSELL